MSAVFEFKICDFCGGDVYSDASPYGVQSSCAQCGRAQFVMPDNMESVLALARTDSGRDKAA